MSLKNAFLSCEIDNKDVDCYMYGQYLNKNIWTGLINN